MDKDAQQMTSDDNQGSSQKSSKQEMHYLSKETPLYFSLRINGEYYISFQKDTYKATLIKAAIWIAINIIIIQFVTNLDYISGRFKDFIVLLLLSQNILYLALSFVDPGTIFEDQDDGLDSQRSFCMTCSLYKLHTSKHCQKCNKCVQRYDHHCSFFGKCIGKRNTLIFYSFLLATGLGIPSIFLAVVLNTPA